MNFHHVVLSSLLNEYLQQEDEDLEVFFLFNCTEFGTESSVGQSYDVGTIRQLACSSGPLGGLRIKGDRSR